MGGRFFFLLAWLVVWRSIAANPGSEVVVVYNSASADSKAVADHYAAARQVPREQIIGLELPESESMTRTDFEERLQQPLWRELLSRALFIPRSPLELTLTNRFTNLREAKIRYAVLCYGVPVKIQPDVTRREPDAEKLPIELRRNEAAVDSELALLPMFDRGIALAGPIINPFQFATNREFMHPTNGVLMVTRLDGPSAEVAKGLVDKALIAEREGLWGRAYIDSRGLTDGPYKPGDDWLRNTYEVVSRYGFECVTNNAPETFPPSTPLSDIALYFGWYDQSVSGPFTNGMASFRPGAIAYHLHSFSARTLRVNDVWWAGPLLDRGATATLGCTEEPYLTMTPQIHILAHRLLYYGFSFGEAAYACQMALSWQNTVIGDPLYRPFAKDQQARHEELEKSKNKNIEWSILMFINQRIQDRAPLDEILKFYDTNPHTTKSAVLQEKLGDIFKSKGKLIDAIDPYLRALKLEMNPIQRLRVTLSVASLLSSFGKPQQAYEFYEGVLRDFPGYTAKKDIYQRLAKLAARLEKKQEAAEFERLGSQ